MALVFGTNCGFCAVSPTVDPGEAAVQMDGYEWATKDTTPVTASTITEIGWWCDDATSDENFEVGIYDHNVGDDNPEAVVGALSQTNAKGADAGWKKVTGLNISITASTIYWIAIQLDAGTTTNTNSNNGIGGKSDRNIATTLSVPWGASAVSVNYPLAIYAVWEGADEVAGQDGPYVY